MCGENGAVESSTEEALWVDTWRAFFIGCLGAVIDPFVRNFVPMIALAHVWGGG
jgi:hypothetical protein